jgi:hypothetical protein
MKVLYLDDWNHPCNHEALMSYGFEITAIKRFDIDKIDLNEFDCVYSPSYPVKTSKYPHLKFIFGPHFSVFPENNKLDFIRSSNAAYIVPSDWVLKLWNSFDNVHGITLKTLPFAINTDLHKNDQNEKTNIFVYFKQRNKKELEYVETFLKSKNFEYKVFHYGHYKQDDYIEYLKKSKFGIWIGCHESQGFALQIALSRNIPLLVWDINESSYGNKRFFATSIPYWNNSCGEFYIDVSELENKFEVFMSKLQTYCPRQYIIDNLSINACRKKFEDIAADIHSVK